MDVFGEGALGGDGVVGLGIRIGDGGEDAGGAEVESHGVWGWSWAVLEPTGDGGEGWVRHGSSSASTAASSKGRRVVNSVGRAVLMRPISVTSGGANLRLPYSRRYERCQAPLWT